MDLGQLLTLLAPPRCVACGRPCGRDGVLCGACRASLDATSPPPPVAPPGIDCAWATAPHDSVARGLVTALKFGGLLAVAGLMAERIAETTPEVLRGDLVPVPPAPLRSHLRGFDPAEAIAVRLADRCGLALRPCLARAGGPRQVGRSRSARLANRPRVWAPGEVPRAALLVDDVQTTGTTLAACAAALRGAGAEEVRAVSFARSL